MLTLIRELDLNSDLRNQLGDLALFNFLCGTNDETADIDYKHILKRLRNTSLILMAGVEP